jgi:hypothetical protein
VPWILEAMPPRSWQPMLQPAGFLLGRAA